MHWIEATMALGLRRGLVAANVGQTGRDTSAAVVIFDGTNEVISASATAQERIAELGGDLWGMLPSSITTVVSAAGAAKVIPLIVEAYGLTDRERDVVQHVLLGDSTNQIAAALHLSPYTVQDHLKVIFEKVGVSSRRELSSRIFFSQYAGRLGRTLHTDGWFNG
ncbi:helix-turn-helix transcriptional regulator [Kribbella sp. NPDC051620]|uniref:helix-turn-helix transcriptional regulator n=1 Tax=Kribbella sp. NPDC051620 TaxID=3364120 RepID=UPI00378A9895